MSSAIPLLALLLSLASGMSPPTETPRATPIPSCGFCSAYSFLYCLNVPASVESLEDAFGSADVSRAISVAELRGAIAKMGVETEAVRFSPKDSARLPTPCILYLAAGRWPHRVKSNVGHFVTLVKYVDDRAVILDWSGVTVEPAVHISAAEIAKYWDGDAIVTTSHHWPIFVGIGALALGAVVFRKHVFRAFLLLVALVPLGCSTESQPEVIEAAMPSLVFSKPHGNMGVLSATSLHSHDFEFRVWDKSPVVIREVEASCGCTVAEKSLFGRDLAAGSTHQLRIQIRLDGNASTRSKSLRVLTEPPSPVPLVLAVTYTRLDPPQLSVNRFIVESTPEQHAEGEMTVTYQRPLSESPLNLEKSKCQFGDFVLLDAKQTSENVVTNVATQDSVGEDTIRLRFRASTLQSYGIHDSRMQFAFSDGSSQLLPTRVVIPHPISISTDRLFVGVLLPGEACEKSIRVASPTKVGSIKVSHTGGMISHSSIVADSLVIRIVAPQTPGRHETTLTLEAQQFPPLTIPVACVVRKKG